MTRKACHFRVFLFCFVLFFNLLPFDVTHWETCPKRVLGHQTGGLTQTAQGTGVCDTEWRGSGSLSACQGGHSSTAPCLSQDFRPPNSPQTWELLCPPPPHRRILVLNPVVTENEPDSFQMSQGFTAKADEALNSSAIGEAVSLSTFTQMGQEALEPPRGTRRQGGGGASGWPSFLIRRNKVVDASAGPAIKWITEWAGAAARVPRDTARLL